MGIIGTHNLLYSPEPDAVRAVFRDVLGYEHVNAGEGWLIFKLPPAEVGVHPSDGDTSHAMSFICDEITSTMAELGAKGIEFTGPPEDHGYGLVTYMKLPGGLQIQLYEPRHPTAI